MADRRVRWTDAARLDLEQIVHFVAEDTASNALAVLERTEHRSQTLDAMPQRGRIVPELRAAGVQTYRELVEGPWRIVYRYDDRDVYVIAVLDARRDLSSLLLERLAR